MKLPYMAKHLREKLLWLSWILAQPATYVATYNYYTDMSILYSGYNVQGAILCKVVIFLPSSNIWNNISEPFNHRNTFSHVKSGVVWYTCNGIQVHVCSRILYYRLYDKRISLLQRCLVRFYWRSALLSQQACLAVTYATTTIFLLQQSCKGMMVVGHMPRKISVVYYVILGRQDKQKQEQLQGLAKHPTALS